MKRFDTEIVNKPFILSKELNYSLPISVSPNPNQIPDFNCEYKSKGFGDITMWVAIVLFILIGILLIKLLLTGSIK